MARARDKARAKRQEPRGKSEDKRPGGIAGRLRVPPDKLCWTCTLGGLKFDTTDDLATPDRIIGQRRALDALELGLEVSSVGYNIFVSGPVGTGRTTTVRRLLELTRGKPAHLADKCYVNNFKDPDQPRLICLKPGKGRELKKEMDDFIEYLVKNIPLLFESDNYQHSREEIVNGFKERGSARVRDFEKRVAAEGFALVQTGPFQQPELAPIVDKQPVKTDALAALVEEKTLNPERAEEIKAKYRALSDELSAIFKEIREFERQARDALVELDKNVVRPVLDARLEDIAEKHGLAPAGVKPQPGVARVSAALHRPAPKPGPDGASLAAYLSEWRDAVLANIDQFRPQPADKAQPEVTYDPYLELRVNVLVDNAGEKSAPVIFETNPTYKNLFGSIDRVWDRSGQWRADFSKIKAGSILRADSGYLVLNALDALMEPGVWPVLKRTLRNRQLEISAPDQYAFLFGSTSLKPEPIDIDVKVIMIGDPEVYGMLAQYDEDFKKVFKVRADFDWVMPLGPDAVREYAEVVKTLCDKEKLLPFDRSGVRGVIEYGVRLAGRQNKVSTRFNIVSELLTEASHWASRAGAKTVTHDHVQQAIDRRRERVRLYEEKLQEAINEGTIYIDVTGTVTGQVNGLAVYETGEYAFGKPARITAKTGVGAAGIINIERESQLSGPTHDKGVYIIAGYLRHKYAGRHPLVLSASICFEQSYGGVDGDSASSTEVYALLSDLAGLPVRQDLAVTGSVNQRGQIQPIGGVNWKVEGFFETCRARGFTGTQGVIVPRSNLPDLMLRPEVVKAVEEGRFHVYAVSTVDEGIELLTGTAAGKPGKDGSYPRDTVNGRVMARLEELARLHQEFGAEKSDKGAAPEKKKRRPEKKVPRGRR